MKILVAGNGKMGASLTKQLTAEGCDLTVIDENPGVLESIMEDCDVMGIEGNCASMDTLRDAGVEDADLLVAMTGKDEVNLLCCMTAHSMNPRLHTVTRIKNPEYAGQIYSLRSAFGLSMAVNPDRQAASEIGRLIKYPGFLKRDTFARGTVEIVELRVREDSKAIGVPLSKLNSVVRCQILVCAAVRDGEVTIPSGDFVLKEGDRLFVTGDAENLATLLKHLGIITRKARRVLIAGGSRISYYLAQALIRHGIDVRIIENNQERCRELASDLPEATVVLGDAGDQKILDKEGIADCDAFVTLTGVDETNIVLSIFGTHRGVPQVITKLSREENVQMLDDLPVGSIISPKDLCTNSIVRYVRAMENQVGAAVSVHMIADGQAEAIEFILDENTMHCGEPLKNLKLRKHVLIACASKRGKSRILTGDSTFEKGDSVIVISAGEEVIGQFNDIFLE